MVGRLPDIGDVGGDRKAKLQNLEAEAQGEIQKTQKWPLEIFKTQKRHLEAETEGEWDTNDTN